MPGRDRQLKVTVVGDASSLQRAFGRASGSLGGFAGGLKKVAGIAGLGGLAIAAKRGVEAAVELSTGFETNLSKIVGLVGISRDQVNEWADDIKTLAPEVAKAPEELADAMFFITSAGLRGATAMDTLKASARAASAGLGETKEVAFAAVSAMNAYGQENLSAEQAVDILTNTVRQGNVEASEVASVLGSVIPVAAELGLSFDQVGASVAAMTRLGANASESVTNLQGIFRAIIKPSSQAEQVLSQYGLSASGLRQQLKEEGLLSVLGTLSEVFADNEEAATKVFGRIQGLTGFLSLMGSNAEQNVEIFDALANSAGTADEAFEAMEETAGFKLQSAFTKLKVIGTDVGDQVVPQLVEAVEGFLPVLEDLLPVLGDLLTAFLDLMNTLAPLANFTANFATSAIRGFTFQLDLLGDAVGLTDGRLADMARAQQHLDNVMSDGKDPAVGLANAILDLARTGEVTEDQWKRLASQSGLTDERLDDVKRTLLDYARNADDANVSTTELALALGQTTEASELTAASDRVLTQHTGEVVEALEEEEEALKPATEEARSLAEMLATATLAQQDFTNVLLAASDPLFGAIDAFGNYQDALEDYNEALEDPKTSSEDLARLQFEVAEAALKAQDGLDKLDGQALEDAMAAIGAALGLTRDEVAGLLSELGLLDGKQVTAVVRVKAPEFTYEQRGNDLVVRRGSVRTFRRGGIVGPNNRELAAIGEAAAREAIIPLDQRGIAFMAEALRKALERVGPNAGTGGGNLQQEFIIQGGMNAQELADEIEFRRRTSGV